MQALGLQPKAFVEPQKKAPSDIPSTAAPIPAKEPLSFSNVGMGNFPGRIPQNQTLNVGSQVSSSNVFSKILERGTKVGSPQESECFSKEESKNHMSKFSHKFLQQIYDDQSQYSLQELTGMKNSHATPASIRNASMYVSDRKAAEEHGPWVVPKQPQDLLASTSADRKIMRELPIARLIDRRDLFAETDNLAPKDLAKHFGKRTKQRYWEKGSNTKNRSHSHSEGTFVFETHCRLFAAHEAALKVTAALTDVASALSDQGLLAQNLPAIRARIMYLVELLARINGITVNEFQALKRKDMGDKSTELWYKSLSDDRQEKLKSFPHFESKHQSNETWNSPSEDSTPKISEIVKRDFHNLGGRLQTLQKSEHIGVNEVVLVGTMILNRVGYTTFKKTGNAKRRGNQTSTVPAKKQRVNETVQNTTSTTIPKKKKKKKKNKKSTQNNAGN